MIRAVLRSARAIAAGIDRSMTRRNALSLMLTAYPARIQDGCEGKRHTFSLRTSKLTAILPAPMGARGRRPRLGAQPGHLHGKIARGGWKGRSPSATCTRTEIEVTLARRPGRSLPGAGRYPPPPRWRDRPCASDPGRAASPPSRRGNDLPATRSATAS
jgi:hypothetical protein